MSVTSSVRSFSAGAHLDETQRKLLAELDSSVEKRTTAAKGKAVRHQLIRKPTATQQARWEEVQQAKSRGQSLTAIARELGMSRVATRKYALADSPPTKLLSAKERAKAEALLLAQSQMPAD
ncbi:MAG: hypothetical protein OXR67_05065 [Chloroflexota bacterium]|nr:hypothetical protein [Chloroflexota bacterium]